MHSQMKIIRSGEQITLISQNGGRALALLLGVEVALLGGLILLLAAVLPDVQSLWAPIIVSIALMAWTAAQMKSDYRITMDLAARQGQVVRIAPLTGERTAASFPLAAVESLVLRQTNGHAGRQRGFKQYVVSMEMHGGHRHVLSARGPMLVYRDNVERFARAAGINSRVIRQAAT